MVVSFDNLTPYLSIVLLKIIDDSFSINSLRNELTPTKKDFEVKESDNGQIYHVNYQDKKKASWHTLSHLFMSINYDLKFFSTKFVSFKNLYFTKIVFFYKIWVEV